MIDVDKVNLTMIPFGHTLVGKSDEIIRITKENKTLKIGLTIAFGILILAIIITNRKDDTKK